MKKSFGHVLKARYGILFTAAVGAVSMLVTAGLFALPLMRMYSYAMGDPEMTEAQAMDILRQSFERSSTANFEIVSLITAAICAALLARNALGFFKANGVSGRTASGALYSSVPVTALLLTSEDLLMRLCLVRNTIFINSRDLLRAVMGQSAACDSFADSPALTAELAGTGAYFLAALFLMYAVMFACRPWRDRK